MINCTFQQIEAFLIVAERLNFTEAAEEMYLSQSAMSKLISRLETGIGVKLFNRENRGVSLTEEGLQLRNLLSKSYNEIANALEDVRVLKDCAANSLRISYPSLYDYNSSFDCVKRTINKFCEEYPEVELNEIIYEYDQQKKALLTGEVDVIITHSSDSAFIKGTASVILTPLDSCILISAEHRFAKYDEIPTNELENETIYRLFFGSKRETDEQTRAICDLLGFTPGVIKYVPNVMSLIRIISAGKGVGICDKIDNTPSDMRLKCYPIHLTDSLSQRIIVAWRKDDLSGNVERLIDILKKM